jgi:hypothetical protein
LELPENVLKVILSCCANEKPTLGSQPEKSNERKTEPFTSFVGKVKSIASLRSRERSEMQKKKRTTDSEMKAAFQIHKMQVHSRLASLPPTFLACL